MEGRVNGRSLRREGIISAEKQQLTKQLLEKREHRLGLEGKASVIRNDPR